MTDEPQAPSTSSESSGSPEPVSLTRAFVFADLRGYTQLVETHGAAQAAGLLERYRSLVRTAVSRFGGAEIKTEGDSFYVVFDSVSASVRCALAIQEAAADASAEVPDPPIRVGVGIHAGETVAVADGFVGSAVNVAARLCALAGPGEVLVSETVRTLSQTVVPVVFEPRGRQRLKGVADQVGVYSVLPVAEADDAWAAGIRADRRRRSRRRRTILAGAGVVGLVLVIGASAFALRPPPGLPTGPWTISADLSLTGPYGEAFGPALADAVRLAIDEANAAGDLGVELRLDVRDHGAPAPQYLDRDRSVANVNAFVADPRVIALVGPIASDVARAQVPITNAAGLLHCSPATTDPRLTKPREGALDLRATAPDRINFIRTAPADDIQGRPTASLLRIDLGVRHLLIVEEPPAMSLTPDEIGRDPVIMAADSVAKAFEDLGGQVTRRTLNPGAAPATALEPLASAADPPGAVFYAGIGPPFGHPVEVRAAMIDAGHGEVPYVFWDWVSIDPEFITDLGTGAVGAWATHASFAPPRSAFVDRYRAAYGREPGEYEAAGYACLEVILAALRDLAKEGASTETIREALRAEAVDPAKRYETVLGTIGFDANGDSLQQFAQVFRADPEGAGGQPEWVLVNSQDYGPAP